MTLSDRNLIFVGMPGCGKTTVAQLVASRLGRDWYDLDAEIERVEGRTIAEIFKSEGEECFRPLETRQLERLLRQRGIIIATGGGAVLCNSGMLRRNSVVVYLVRSYENINNLLFNGDRPLLCDNGDWHRIYDNRRRLYEAVSDITVVNDGPAETTAYQVIHLLEKLTMKLLVINGPNINMLGRREPEIYGYDSYGDLVGAIERHAAETFSIPVDVIQHNSEGDIIDALQAAPGRYAGVVINPGAYSHYSIAIRDAIVSIEVPVIEVHISNIAARETFRQLSVTAPACVGSISGLGFDGYIAALDWLAQHAGS